MKQTLLTLLRRFSAPAVVTAEYRHFRSTGGHTVESYEVRGPFKADFGHDSYDVLIAADGSKFYMPIWGRLIVEAK